jgi:hypothetical protein
LKIDDRDQDRETTADRDRVFEELPRIKMLDLLIVARVIWPGGPGATEKVDVQGGEKNDRQRQEEDVRGEEPRERERREIRPAE